MKNIFLLTILLSASAAFAGPQFACRTKTDEGYYVKKNMKVEVKNAKSIFVQPYDTFAEEWNDGSVGKLYATKADGTAAFKGFNSEDLFGPLSEGIADQGIYVYVSSAVMAGRDGKLSLFARGTEVGLEKAIYSCIREE